ncbi:Serine/threonine-protein kinase atr [Favolaschia claudopus]|uniref:non-specific serine/threonine protein kinase n=1 Tax=Favolaschia claudopus TaxID=2862362 RepID=A0AAW0EFY4_9AGAR
MSPPATPFPAFDDPRSNASPQEFLDFLHNLVAQNLDGDPAVRIPASSKDLWVTVVAGLSEQFLASFPSTDRVQWHVMHEKVKLAAASLDVIRRVANRVEDVFYGPGELARRTFARLLNFCNVVEMWLDVEFEQLDGLPTPRELADDALQTALLVLRSLGGAVVHITHSKTPLWKTLRQILADCLEVVNGKCNLISRSSTLVFPVAITLFSKTPVQDATTQSLLSPESEDKSFSLVLESIGNLPTFLSTTLNILVQSICPPLLTQWFLTDLTRQLAEALAKTFDYCLSSSCIALVEKRAAALLKLANLRSFSPDFSRHVPDLLFRLLRHRLQEDTIPGWDTIDPTLQEAFQSPLFVPPSKADLVEILTLPAIDSWGEPGRSLVIEYVRSSITHLSADLVRQTRQILTSYPVNDRGLLRVLDDRIAKDSLDGSPEDAARTAKWREDIKECVQEIIYPITVAWMEEDGAMAEVDYAQRAVDDVKARFERQLMDSEAPARVALLDKLIHFGCAVSGCQQSDRAPHAKRPNMSTLPSGLSVTARLLDGPEGEVTVPVRRRAYTFLSDAIKHHTITAERDGIDHAATTCLRGISDPDRSVRLVAGSALAALVALYAAEVSDAWKFTQPLFSQLNDLLAGSKIPVKETLLILGGFIAKTKNREIMGQALCFLIAHVGNSNPVLRGTTYMQIIAAAEHHKKSVMALLLPYFDQIAPFLVLRMCTQPELLVESCRMMHAAPEDFLSTTLPRTLPHLFAACDVRVIEAIGKALNSKPSTLLLNNSAEILAHLFLLRGPGQTKKAMSCLLNVLMDSANQKGIDTQSVVKSSIVQLIAQLVIVMGDEDPDIANSAVPALEKVEQVMAPDDEVFMSDLAAFLKTYMLGVVTYVNEMLRDGRGKISLVMKRKILRSLGHLVTLIGPSISTVAPQIMATFQTMIGIPELSEVTLQSWHTFLSTPAPRDIGPHVGPTSAAFVSSWSTFPPASRELATKSLEYIIIEVGGHLGSYLDEVTDLASIPELDRARRRLKQFRASWSPKQELQKILDRAWSDNLTVAIQSLGELKTFMLEDRKEFVSGLASGDIFDPLVDQLLSALFAAACREGDGADALRLLAFECIGALGAVDPDRFEIGANGPTMIMTSNFTNEEDSMTFALHLIQDLLVGAFRSTSDIRYQSQLAYCIQELLKFCKFTPALVGTGISTSVPIKVRNRWNNLPKHVVETAAPLLEGRFAVPPYGTAQNMVHPIYPCHSTYREWIQWWSVHLITRASGQTAQVIFGVFRQAVRNKDVVVAHHLLPHLVLNILISGNESDTQDIRTELLTVLEDQVDPSSPSTEDKKLLSAQVVFTLLDHLNKWVRIVRQDLTTRKHEHKRSRNAGMNQLEEQLMRVDSILSSIDENLMAKAALKCKAYARSLMNFERQIVTLQEQSPHSDNLNEYYERLHEIYSYIDQPDGMEGVSTLILSPSLEHQIRQHENTGRWTSAQSCWEVRLQQSPDNLDFHLGLLHCLRNLGHYDTLRTHVRGVLTRNPEWQQALAGFHVESAWMVGAWDDVEDLVNRTSAQSPATVIARVLLAMKSKDVAAIDSSLSLARTVLGTPITAAGAKGHRRSYEAVLDLHVAHELELIYNALTSLPTGSQGNSQLRKQTMSQLNLALSARFDSTLPTFRTREPVLSMRRTAFALIPTPRKTSAREIARSWLASAKIARKAGQWQTAYSAVLQAQQSGNSRFSFMESAKLVKAAGEPLRALQELENSMRALGLLTDRKDFVDLTTEDDNESKRMKAKAIVLRARWMNESERFDNNTVFGVFVLATELQPNWESGHFHLGQFHDQCYKALPQADKFARGLRMNASTVKSFARAIKHGSKYVYQTVPRLLTIWLDLGEDRRLASQETFKKLNEVVAKIIKDAPVYKWFTAFPQIVSRVGHENEEVYKNLSKLIIRVLEEYPKQALWLFTSVVKSTKKTREQRGKEILQKLTSSPNANQTGVSKLVAECTSMTNQLLYMCDAHVGDEVKTISMQKQFPSLFKLGRSELIIPLQESLTASLPPNSSSIDSDHQPFPANAPTFHEFFDEIEVMRSLAKPRKITIRGSNGQIYMFLGKPKDDLRKDARLMDFNAIINKLLKANSESRRRQLHIRTYGVVTLNEECGFIQWVPNTIPLRPVLMKGYDARRIKSWSSEMNDIFRRVKDSSDRDAAELFRSKVLVNFPPVFHDWFIETFPEPSAWLASRLAYGRTAAVMSMVGFILGLGDRHCENILLDTNTGDTVHVDFNCLFEKGKTLETPERVPFRLTQNIIDGLGVTGVEGVFRIACEVTLQLLRDNKDSLMSVLDAFIHDPLVEWEDEKRKLEREPIRRNQVKSSVDLRMLGKNALKPIEQKLKGLYVSPTFKDRAAAGEKEVSTGNLVQMLIQEATDLANLAKMYPGWASWH